ncbi:MAG: hypothetical protein CMB57_04000 [Euryarchaeota archaeon]|nr:hypothetical protein [Euryarchaeota archaeon]
MEIKVPKGQAFAFETDDMMFKSHQSCLVIGKRGSGKSVIAVNIIERMKYMRCFCVSPTIQSNKALLDRLKIDPDDIYDPDDLGALDDIKRKIDEERDLYEKYLADMKKYKEFMKKLNGENPIFRIPDEVLLMFYQNGTFQKPRHKWGGRRPHMAILFDDVMGSLLFTKGIRKLNKMTIFHRHLGQLEEGGALGCSLYFLVQSYKAQAGGISKTIRNQATSIVLFKTKNDKELQEVQEECSGEISKETFYQIYEQATEGEHNALVIDLHYKKGIHPSGFRKNLDTFLIPEQFSQADSK